MSSLLSVWWSVQVKGKLDQYGGGNGMSLKNLRTQFVKDRMAETSWNDRTYIYDLELLEKFVTRGGPKSYNEVMVFWHTRDPHSLEFECIKKEIRDGVYTSPEEFRQLVATREREKAAKAELAEQRRKAEEDEERRQWLELGGRP